jgi:hypothetical protein
MILVQTNWCTNDIIDVQKTMREIKNEVVYKITNQLGFIKVGVILELTLEVVS